LNGLIFFDKLKGQLLSHFSLNIVGCIPAIHASLCSFPLLLDLFDPVEDSKKYSFDGSWCSPDDSCDITAADMKP